MKEVAQDKEFNQNPESFKELLEELRDHYSAHDIEAFTKAYYFSEKAHEGQIRRSGEPYILHPICVSAILASLKLDMATVITGLLHDTVEDTFVTLDQVKTEFGPTVAHLVDGVTKITQMDFRDTHEKQGENIRKMIVSMGKDVRVILVKLADRLHNMRTLHHMPYKKQARIAQETLDIYAPLASRLGIHTVKVELEDLSFRYAYPDMYYELAQKVAKKKKEREKYIDDVKKILLTEIKEKSKVQSEFSGRPKHLYSIYKKMKTKGLDFEQIYDIIAFRVCVSKVSECYEVLGLIHSLWKPIPGRFKDFIAMPKNNNYQSLHTTVIGPGAERIEIQIRTHEMHLVAEKGIAAHWSYKEESRGAKASEKSAIDRYNWLRELIQMHQQTQNPDEFLENVKTELFDSEIYVFTPKGEIKEFPEGATPIDFAFSVHTDLGSKIVAARVNGRLVPLKYKMKNGDNIEVITSKNQTPNKDWLNFCVTSKAKSKIRFFVKKEQRDRAIVLGKELLEKSFRKNGASASRYLKGEKFEQFLSDNGCPNVDDLYAKVGFGKLTPKYVMEQMLPQEELQAPTEEAAPSFIQKAFNVATQKKRKASSIIEVDGMSDVLVRFAKCCNPIPGDPIMGFITLGRGIVIHRSDCSKAYEFDPDRRIDVSWSKAVSPDLEREVRIRVTSLDKPGLLREMSEVFHSGGVNIHNAQIRTTKDMKAICNFDVSIKNTDHLSQVVEKLQKLKGVIGVMRVTKT